MGTLSAAISHLLGGDSAVRPQRRQRSGVFPGPATGARSGCSSGPESVFGLRIGVRLAPESVFRHGPVHAPIGEAVEATMGAVPIGPGPQNLGVRPSSAIFAFTMVNPAATALPGLVWVKP